MRKTLCGLLAFGLAGCTVQRDFKIQPSSVEFYGNKQTDKPFEYSHETIAQLETVSQAQKETEKYITSRPLEKNFFRISSTDDVLLNGFPGSCTEGAFCIYVGLEDDGLQPQFVLLKRTVEMHMTNLLYKDGLYGLCGINKPDLVYPTHKTIPKAIEALNYHYIIHGKEPFKGYKLMSFNPEDIKHNTMYFSPFEFFGFTPVKITADQKEMMKVMKEEAEKDE